jgi:hypothetical protein
MVGRRGTVALTALGALAFVATSCGSNYRYVNNAQEKTFFRLPSGMQVFRVRTDQPSDRLAPVTSPTSNEPWHVVFDAAADPSPDHLNDDAPASIVGEATVIPVDLDTSESISVKQARSVLAGGDDPLDTANSGDGSVEIVSFAEINDAPGLTGSRVVYNKKVSADVWTTFDQTSLVDLGTHKVYFFEVKCEATCFKAQHDRISQIVDSWQVRK